MRWGKFEIEGSVILFITLFVVILGMVVMAGRLDIEKEKTKQLELQKDIEYIRQQEDNNNV